MGQKLQTIAVIIGQHIPAAKIQNITPTYLNRIKTEHIEAVWPGVAQALNRMFNFLDSHLHLKGPRLIPYRYFYLAIASHFYENKRPNYDFLTRYFWYYSFHSEDLLTNTTHLQQHVDLLDKARVPGALGLDRFLIDKERLRAAAYSTRGRMSSAILCLLANQEPKDWANPERRVLTEVYYALQDRPNLHHIFPLGYLGKHPSASKLDSDSLMNIAYLTQLTNDEISDDNPMRYLRKYDKPGFEVVLGSHLIPVDLLQWSRQDGMPDNGLDVFIERRIDLILEDLKRKLSGVTFDVIDSRRETR